MSSGAKTIFVKDHKGVKVLIQTENVVIPHFVAHIEEGVDLEGDSYESITKKIDSYLERKVKQAKETAKPVPIVFIEKSREDKTVPLLVPSVIRGIHSENGHPIVKIGDNPARTMAYGTYRNFVRPLSKDEEAKFQELAEAQLDAVQAYEGWLESRWLGDLATYFQEQQPQAKK